MSEEAGFPETVQIMRDQAVKLMSLAMMIREGEIDFRGHEEADCVAARELLADVAEECALQMGGLSNA
jgi:hypothetical protein